MCFDKNINKEQEIFLLNYIDNNNFSDIYKEIRSIIKENLDINQKQLNNNNLKNYNHKEASKLEIKREIHTNALKQLNSFYDSHKHENEKYSLVDKFYIRYILEKYQKGNILIKYFN